MPDSRRLDERLKIASPCSESWDAMRGTDRMRFCSHCDLSVHDASRMTRRELEALVRASDGRLCMRIVYDPLGRVRTLDAPPTPAPVPLVRRAARLAAGAMTVALAAGASAPAFAGPESAAAAATHGTSKTKPSGRLGTLVGVVADPSGAAIENATVEVRDAKNAVIASGTTDEIGSYRIDVPAGSYEVRFGASGFATSTVDADVSAGHMRTVSATLGVGLVGEVVTIRVSPAYDLVWHTDERGGPAAKAAKPPLAETDDLEAALAAAPRDVDERDVFGDTALMFLADRAEAARRLLAAGASANAADMFGATPLMRAALSEEEEPVTLLLNAGANVNATDNARLTALMVAASRGNEDVVEALLAAGADVRAVDARGETALSYAREAEADGVVRILRKAGAR